MVCLGHKVEQPTSSKVSPLFAAAQHNLEPAEIAGIEQPGYRRKK
jgi:hypothetical protein